MAEKKQGKKKEEGHQVSSIRTITIRYPDPSESGKGASILKNNPRLAKIKYLNKDGELKSVFPNAGQNPILVSFVVYLTHLMSPCVSNHDIKDRYIDAARESGMINQNQSYGDIPEYVRRPEDAEDQSLARYFKDYVSNFLSYQSHHAFAEIHQQQVLMTRLREQLLEYKCSDGKDLKDTIEASNTLTQLTERINAMYQQIFAAKITNDQVKEQIEKMWEDSTRMREMPSEEGGIETGMNVEQDDL